MNDLVGLNRDTAHANEALDKPDQKAIQERIDLIQSTVSLSRNIIGKVASAQQQAAADKMKSATTAEDRLAALIEYKSWDVGGDKRIMADVAAGLIAVGLGAWAGRLQSVWSPIPRPTMRSKKSAITPTSRLAMLLMT